MGNTGIDVIAAIDAGSNYLRLIIAEVKENGEMNLLEDLRKPTNIGRDSFSYGRIGVQTIHNTCMVLKGFTQIMKEYKVKSYKAISTSGIREAENKEYISDQIFLKTGLKIDVINNAQERFYIYKALRSYLYDFTRITEEGVLIVNLTSGTVEISVYKKGMLRFTEYIRVGALRVREMLADLEDKTLNFPKIVEEFILSRLDTVGSKIKKMELKNFIALGGELTKILELCNEDGELSFLKGKDLNELYENMKSLSTEQIIGEYNLPRKQAEVLLPSVIIFKCFLKMTNADRIATPTISLRQGILADMVDERINTARKQDSLKDIISSVWYIGKKYGIDETHARNVEQNAIHIFDETWKIHRLGDRERLYLQVAAILHNVGKYISLDQQELHSYNIIRAQDIMGFSNAEVNIIANVAQYHLNGIPNYNHISYRMLLEREKIIVAKLAAILKLAKSLDISHRQKIQKIEIIITGEELYFKVLSGDSLTLEEWHFSNSANFFEEVMGVRPIIKHKG